MKIYTSYFSNANRLGAAGVKQIGISLFPPKWFTGVSMKQVAPTMTLFKSTWLNDEQYERRFRQEVLSKVDAWDFYQRLERVSDGKDVALCCFEKDRKDCHRKLVAEWLERELGIEVPEFEEAMRRPSRKEEQKTKIEDLEPTLF